MKRRLQDWLTLQAQRRPESVAIVFRGQSTTYGALEQASNRLARGLQAVGCARGDRVALLLPKSAQALVAMFASLKADCIYVPLDTTSPVARIGRILQTCDCRCLLADRSTAGLLDDLLASGAVPVSTRIGWMDEGAELRGGVAHLPWAAVEALSGSPIDSAAQPADAAHILFTSGSTGVPKGVIITHANVIHFVRWAGTHFGMTSSDRISGHPPLHFDLSTFDIYGTIAAGAQLHLVAPELSLLPHKLADFIRDGQLTQWFSVPSVLHQMAKADAVRHGDFPALKRLLWCGEKFPTPALMYWMKRLPHVTFDNLYGPTEATIASSFYRVPSCPANETVEVPIGAPCGGELLLVLDDQLRPVEPGETGDLFIGGVGLSPGYWRDTEKTNEVFRANLYSSNPSDRIYKTGDLAKIGEGGLIYLLGRSDSQIKSRGYRIEMGEIEAALHAVRGVQEAAVVAFDSGGPDGKTICCAYVAARGADLPAITLKKHLAGILPRYMVPRRWMELELMPRNGNGKTDRPFLRQQFERETQSHEHVDARETSRPLGSGGPPRVLAAAE